MKSRPWHRVLICAALCMGLLGACHAGGPLADVPPGTVIPLLYYSNGSTVFMRFYTKLLVNGRFQSTEEHYGLSDAIPQRACDEAVELYGGLDERDLKSRGLLDYACPEGREIYLINDTRTRSHYAVIVNGETFLIPSPNDDAGNPTWNLSGDTLYLIEAAGGNTYNVDTQAWERRLAVHSLDLTSGKLSMQTVALPAEDPNATSHSIGRALAYCDGAYLYYTETTYQNDDTFIHALGRCSLKTGEIQTYTTAMGWLHAFYLLEDTILLVGNRDGTGEFPDALITETVGYDFAPVSRHEMPLPAGYTLAYNNDESDDIALLDGKLYGLFVNAADTDKKAFYAYDPEQRAWGETVYFEFEPWADRGLLDYKLMCVGENGELYQLNEYVPSYSATAPPAQP